MGSKTMTKKDLKNLGFTEENGFLILDLKHDFTLMEGDKNGYLDVFELNHDTLRFNDIGVLKVFIEIINKS
jgi:hypothetical protein